MGKPLSIAKRQSILACHKAGATVSSLSQTFRVSRTTIYTLLNRIKSQGSDGLLPNYTNCGKSRPGPEEFVFRAVRCLRTWHPSWGAEKIRAEMQRMRPELKIPHYRTLHRWFHWNAQIEVSLNSSLPKSKPTDAKTLHEGWQIDAKEEMLIGDGTRNCWLNITDEYSGTVINPPVFFLQ